MTPAEQLTRALVDLAGRGCRPRCGDPVTRDLWTSEDQEQRQLAASWCAGCLVLDECHAAAEATPEVFGVWAGIDRSPPHRGRPPKYPGNVTAASPDSRQISPARALLSVNDQRLGAEESVFGGALSLDPPRHVARLVDR